MCPLCMESRGKTASKRVEAAVKLMNAPRFLTLTAPATDEALADQLSSLRDAFGRLRRSPIWKRHVEGGAYAIEITFNPHTGRWHPHLHAIIDGDYFAQKSIKAAWRAALNASTWPVQLLEGDPLIVHIKACPDRRQVARYIARYICKPESIDKWPDAAIVEYAEALHGVRMLANFGTLHGVTLDPADPNDTPADTEHVLHFPRVDGMACKGCLAARELIGLIVRLHEQARPMFRCPVPSGSPPSDDEVPGLRKRLNWLARLIEDRLTPITDPADLHPRDRTRKDPQMRFPLAGGT